MEVRIAWRRSFGIPYAVSRGRRIRSCRRTELHAACNSVQRRLLYGLKSHSREVTRSFPSPILRIVRWHARVIYSLSGDPRESGEPREAYSADLILLQWSDFTWAQVAFSSSESAQSTRKKERWREISLGSSSALIVPLSELLFLYRRASSCSASLFSKFFYSWIVAKCLISIIQVSIIVMLVDRLTISVFI